MKLTKMLVTVSALVMSTLLLAGCGNSKNSANDNSDTILVWSSSTGPDGQKIKKTIANYNQTKPKYKLKLVTMSGDTFNSKIATGGKSGKGLPDIAMIASEQMKQYVSQGLVQPWDQYLKGTEVKASNYVPAAWKVGTVKGKQYGVPTDIGTWIMYYNKALVDKYAPHALDDNIITYDEIKEAGAKAKADKIYATANDWGMQNYSNIYMQLGGKFVSNGKVNVDNKYSYDALKLMKSLYDDGYMVPKAQDAMKLFSNGKLMFLPEGTWMIGQLNDIKSFKWGATFTPQVDAKHIVNGSGAGQFALMKTKPVQSDAKKKGMVKFFAWLQTNQLEWLKSGVNSPSLKMQDNAEYKKMPQYFLISTKQGQDALRIVTEDGVSYAYSEVDARNWDMITGKANIEKTFKTIQQTVDQKMGQ